MTLTLLQGISFALGVLAYAGLLVFCIVTWFRGITGRALFGATLVTLAFVVAVGATGESALSQSLAFASLFAWTMLLLRALGLELRSFRQPTMQPLLYLLGFAVALTVFGIVYSWTVPAIAFVTQNQPISWLYAAQLLLSVSGLVVIEQLVRNTRDDYRWRIRYLNIGLGVMFAFTVVHNATGLLFYQHHPILTILQPLILALAVPFVAIASLRNSKNQLRVNLSRRFVFRSSVLVITGAGLLLLGLAGYYVRLFGGEIGTALLVLAATVFVVVLLVITGSTQFRRVLHRFIAENLYDYKYDYRAEWRRVSQQLTEPSPDFNLGQQVIRSLLTVLGSSGGAIWRLSGSGTLIPVTALHASWTEPLSPETSQNMATFFSNREWIIDLEDLPIEAESSWASWGELKLLPDARFVIPLIIDERLFGIAVTNQPQTPITLDWEDFDLLKLVARQSAGVLALQQADQVLGDAKQLNHFNQYSAFVVHDVKTIMAQLSLLLENADRHKTNPVFIEDMLTTIDNAVKRMSHLLEQLQRRGRVNLKDVELTQLLTETLSSYRHRESSPQLIHCGLGGDTLRVNADRDRLAAAVGHAIQNAIDATPDSGQVRVELDADSTWARVKICDNGCGMAQEFVDQELFQPFRSTKGVSGMGIGAYQTREYLRSLGGDVRVESTVGEGTTFTLKLPLVASG